MKKIYLLISLISFGFAAQSQTLNSNQFPEPGDLYKYNKADTTGVQAGAAGAAAVWNFASLNLSAIVTVESYLPPVTPSVAGTTTVTGADTLGYNFFKNTATEFSIIGLSDSANINLTAFTDAQKLMTFPFSFNNTLTDNFAFTTTIAGIGTVNATGTVNAVADGTGNIILPQGTFNNVLRVKTIIVTNLDIAGAFTIVQTQTIYEWFDGVYKFPLLRVENTNTTDPFGGPDTKGKTVQAKATGPAGLNTLVNKVNFSLSPNPASDYVLVSLNNALPAKTQVTVTNAIGQVVYQNSNMENAAQNLVINTASFDKGMYFVTLTRNENSTTQKLIVR